MPTKKITKKKVKSYPCPFPGCTASYAQSNHLTNHKKFCQFNPDNMKKIETAQDAKSEILKLKEAVATITPEQNQQIKEKLTELDQPTEQSFREQKEKDIEADRQDLRSDQTKLEKIKVAQQLQKFDASDPSKMSFQDWKEMKMITSLGSDNSSNNLLPLLIQMQDKQNQSQLENQKQIFELIREQDKKSMDVLDKFDKIESIGAKWAKKLGYTKRDSGEKSGMDYIAEIVGNIAEKNLPKLLDIGKQSMDMKQQSQQNPATPEPGIAENIPTSQVNEQEQAHVPTQSPAPQPEQFPSDQDLLNNPQLRDQYSPLKNYPNLQFATNQYLAPTSTATGSMTPSP